MIRRLLEKGCRPFRYLQSVADRSHPVLLESSQHRTELGRYSILCCDPFKKLIARGNMVEVQDLRRGTMRVERGSPFRVASQEFEPHRVSLPRDFNLPFAGGAVGYFSYELRHSVERLPRWCDYDVNLPDMVLCFYDQAVIFDHRSHVTEWVACEEGAGEPPAVPAHDDPAPPQIEPVALESNFEPQHYIEAIKRAKEYIAAGDIFQVNLSQRFSGRCGADGLALYGRLRQINPAPFSAFMRYPDCEVISSSPERFLLVEGESVTTRPIKGTRPRIEGDEFFNRRMAAELAQSEKDHAELTMIVDLERNDLGRVCRYGSVKVLEHAVIETYPTVFHLVSTVAGALFRPEHDEFSLIRATFPGGSITGAPKIRAMEIIEELEPHARSIYTGSLGYISFHGRMDLNIAIRTMLKKDGRVYMHFGGGIVADSVPRLEFEETLHKGKALFEAVNAGVYQKMMGRPIVGK